MQIGCNKDLVSLSAVVLCQFTGTERRKRLVWCSSQFCFVLFLCTHSWYFWRFFSQPPRSMVPRFSASFFIISLSVWTFCLAKFLWGFLCSLSSRHPWGSASCDAHELVALWLSDMTHDPCHKLPLSGHLHVKTRRLSTRKRQHCFFSVKLLWSILCPHFPD